MVLSQSAPPDRERRLATFGLLASSFAALLTILTLDSLDTALWVAIYALTVALPLLSFDAWAVTEFSFDQVLYLSFPLFFTMGLGYVAAFTALVATFWHFHWLCGLAFVVLSLVAFLLSTYCNSKIFDRPSPLGNNRDAGMQ
ncbi:MAG: hypothetical protein AB1711_02060 [Thermodesulfobacteriota bacterium]